MTMHNALKLVFLKTGINLATLLASKVLPRAQGRYPQTHILIRVFSRLTKVFRIERYKTGTRGLEDQHFQRLLDVALRALAYISEEDRYYRQWLGLLFLLIEEELAREQRSMDRVTFARLMRKQWRLKGWSLISDELYARQKHGLFPLALTDHLYTLSKIKT